MELCRESYTGAGARRLARALATERYDGRGGSGGEPPASDFEPPGGAFLVGYVGEEPVACGVCRLGYSSVQLETSNRQLEAIALYRSAGYGPIEWYGPYVEDERSVCFEKRL